MTGRRVRASAKALLGAAACFIAAACPHMGGVRPRITPLAGAVERTVQAAPYSVTEGIVATLDTMRIPLEAHAADEGYVETKWIDPRNHQPHTPAPSNLDHTIKMRFYADPVAGTTHLVAECVRRLYLDPSVPQRELEVVVDSTSAGWMLMDSVLTRLLSHERHVERH